MATITTDKQTLESKLQKENEKEEALIRSVIKKEAELKKVQKEYKQANKERKHIENSKVWKYSKGIRRWIAPRHSLLMEENSRLKKRIEKLTEELKAMEQQVIELKLGLNRWNSGQLKSDIKQAKHEGRLLDLVENLVDQKVKQQQSYQLGIIESARAFNRDKPDERNYVYQKALAGLNIEEVPEFIIREAETEDEVSLKSIASFKGSLTLRARRRQLGENLPEWNLDNKGDAYTFVDSLGVKRPWMDDSRYTLNQIPHKEQIAIKPVNGAGARGVYLVFSPDYIQDVRRSEIVTSWELMIERMQHDLSNQWVEEDIWMIEELIVEENAEKKPARDLKFYCFYGKVGLILEIERYPFVRYCWWSVDGKRVSTGKYEENLFEGKGFSKEELMLAESISMEIPTPFIRIDFMKTSEELIFGEFTPKPGNYDQFNQATDQLLGDYFLAAESRLNNDLISGKVFKLYRQLLTQLYR